MNSWGALRLGNGLKDRSGAGAEGEEKERENGGDVAVKRRNRAKVQCIFTGLFFWVKRVEFECSPFMVMPGYTIWLNSI